MRGNIIISIIVLVVRDLFGVLVAAVAIIIIIITSLRWSGRGEMNVGWIYIAGL